MQGIRKHKESFFHSRLWIVILVIVTIVLSIAVIKMYKKYAHAKDIYHEYTVELAQVEKNKQDLEKNIEALSTDRGKEAEIRDRYRVVKKDEQMILIVDDQKVQSGDNQELSGNNEKSDSFLGRLRAFLRDLW